MKAWLSFFLICCGVAQKPPEWVDKVHVVMMNHLDVGFNVGDTIWDETHELGYIVNVLNTYFDVYFPFAVEVGTNVTKLNKTFTWTTHSWLVSMFMDCPINIGLHCPSEEAKNNFLYGISKGYIAWHSFPFNSQMEMYDESMIHFGLKLSKDAAIKYNLSYIPQVLSQRDVPGITRSIIPILVNNNVSAISIGCNDGSAPPGVPSNIFNWIDRGGSEKSIITMVHKGGYGGLTLNDSVIIKNFNHALVMAFKGDNEGPPNVTEVESYYQQIANEFPSAAKHGNNGIFASTYTAFVDELLKRNDVIEQLPINGDEMGDTWVHGFSSDPFKTAAFRIAQRHRTQCLHSNQCSLNSTAFYNFSRFLLKNGEHTFGGDIKKMLYVETNNNSAYYNWSNNEFYERLNDNNGSNNLTAFRYSWYEQRDFGLTYAMDALKLSNDNGDINLYNNIMKEWNYIHYPVVPIHKNPNDWILINNTNRIFNVISSKSNDEYNIRFNIKTGYIDYLKNIETNINYVSNNSYFGEFIYETLNETDFDEYMYNYTYTQPPLYFVYYDFGKKDLQKNANPLHQYIRTRFKKLYQYKYDQNVFIIEMDFGEKQSNLTKYYGAPQIIYNKVNFSSNESTFSLQLYVINKIPTRIPESIWFGFHPLECSDYNIDILNEPIDLKHIMINGSYHMFGTTGNVQCILHNEINKFVKIYSVDSALVSFKVNNNNEFNPFPVPWEHSDETKGFSFNLFNTIWGTNYPVWYPFDDNDSNTTFRFHVNL